MKLSGELHAPTIFPKIMSLLYPLNKRVGGPQSQPEYGCKKEKSLLLPGTESIIQPIASHYTDTAILYVNAPKPRSRKPGYK
jgi:hypothetical protein